MFTSKKFVFFIVFVFAFIIKAILSPVNAIPCDNNSHPLMSEKTPPGCLCAPLCNPPTAVSCSIAGVEYCCRTADQCTCSQSGGVYTALGCIPAGGTNDLNSFAGWFVSKAIFIASGLAFLFLIYGGFLLLTSSGDPNKVKAGTELISAALSGLLFIIVSVLLLKIIGVDILKIQGFV